MTSPNRRTLILSDLHLGPNNALHSFTEHHALAQFIHHLTHDTSLPTELILAGDVFDFLQCDGYERFDAEQSPAYLDQILAHPGCADLLTALHHFANIAQNRIVLLSGNHDPELLLPSVRRRLLQRIEEHGAKPLPTHAFLFPDDNPPLLPKTSIHPPLWGYAFGPKDHPIWVVHGDRWDPSNAIHRHQLLQQAHTQEVVVLPVGSELVLRILRHIKRQPTRRWLDLLKPEVPTILPLLLYLAPTETKTYLQNNLDLTLRLLASEIRSQLAGHIAKLHDKTWPPTHTTPHLLQTRLAQQLARSLRLQQQEHQLDHFVAKLEDYDQYKPIHSTESRSPTLSPQHDGFRRWLLRTWLLHVRENEDFQNTRKPDQITELQNLHAELVRHKKTMGTLIAGHTHGIRHATSPPHPHTYINSGTWLPVACLPHGKMEDVIEQLDQGILQTAESPRSGVRILWNENHIHDAQLFQCDKHGRPNWNSR